MIQVLIIFNNVQPTSPLGKHIFQCFTTSTKKNFFLACNQNFWCKLSLLHFLQSLSTPNKRSSASCTYSLFHVFKKQQYYFPQSCLLNDSNSLSLTPCMYMNHLIMLLALHWTWSSMDHFGAWDLKTGLISRILRIKTYLNRKLVLSVIQRTADFQNFISHTVLFLRWVSLQHNNNQFHPWIILCTWSAHKTQTDF